VSHMAIVFVRKVLSVISKIANMSFLLVELESAGEDPALGHPVRFVSPEPRLNSEHNCHFCLPSVFLVLVAAKNTV
jgi:hypothetical protein